MSIRAFLVKSVKTIRLTAITLSFGYISFNFIAEPILCSGPSMEPTINEKDIVVIEKFSSVFLKKYNRGDIVVFRSPTSPKTLLCKRVEAIAGDSVRHGFMSHEMVPRGHVWLLGDNTNHSTDSRQFGAVPIGLILGKAVFKIWPIHQIHDFKLLTKDIKT